MRWDAVGGAAAFRSVRVISCWNLIRLSLECQSPRIWSNLAKSVVKENIRSVESLTRVGVPEGHSSSAAPGLVVGVVVPGCGVGTALAEFFIVREGEHAEK